MSSLHQSPCFSIFHLSLWGFGMFSPCFSPCFCGESSDLQFEQLRFAHRLHCSCAHGQSAGLAGIQLLLVVSQEFAHFPRCREVPLPRQTMRVCLLKSYGHANADCPNRTIMIRVLVVKSWHPKLWKETMRSLVSMMYPTTGSSSGRSGWSACGCLLNSSISTAPRTLIMKPRSHFKHFKSFQHQLWQRKIRTFSGYGVLTNGSTHNDQPCLEGHHGYPLRIDGLPYFAMSWSFNKQPIINH